MAMEDPRLVLSLSPVIQLRDIYRLTDSTEKWVFFLFCDIKVASYATGHMPSVFLEAGGRADDETMKKAFELMGEQQPKKYSCHETSISGVLFRV